MKENNVPCHQAWLGQSKVPALPSTLARCQRIPGRRWTQKCRVRSQLLVVINTQWAQNMGYYSQRHRKRPYVPSPSSCLINQQSSGHSWGRLGLCTRLCETVAQCLSALQIPCWQTTAAARRHTTQLCQTFGSCSVNAVILYIASK